MQKINDLENSLKHNNNNMLNISNEIPNSRSILNSRNKDKKKIQLIEKEENIKDKDTDYLNNQIKIKDNIIFDLRKKMDDLKQVNKLCYELLEQINI